MNRSDTTPHSFSTSQLRAAFGDVGGPGRTSYLADIVAEAGRMRQRPAWTFLERWVPADISVRRQGLPRTAVLFVVLSLLVALLAAGLVYVGSQRTQPERLLGLPTTPAAWERVLIETPSGTGSVDSIAAGPNGLLAVVSDQDGDGPTRLVVSSDGRTWTTVPEDRHPRLWEKRLFGTIPVVGTDRGSVLLLANEAWMSENGYDWKRVSNPAGDPDLSMKWMRAASAGGPGLVAVGDDRAWYSTDWSDWSLAEVPPPPTVFFDQRGYPAPSVDMQGLAVAGDKLLAWGSATADTAQELMADPAVSILWASSNGRTWANMLDPEELGSLEAVAAGPGGLIAIESAGDAAAGHPQLVVHVSADGDTWERAGVFDPRSPWPSDAPPYGEGGDIVEGMPLGLEVTSAAATSAGYVVVGGDGVCHPSRADGPPWCLSEEAAVWTSADGRSWSRLPSDDLFKPPASRNPTGAWANGAVAWESRFVIGGVYDGKPAIWMSRSDE